MRLYNPFFDTISLVPGAGTPPAPVDNGSGLLLLSYIVGGGEKVAVPDCWEVDPKDAYTGAGMGADDSIAGVA